MTIKQALVSVSDKTGIVELAIALQQLNFKILSTGGTASTLKQNGISVTEVSDYTGFPEMLDGRVKTLHPKIHAGILARLELGEHQHAMETSQILPIDLVVVNLYPFAQTIAKPDCPLADAIENIDIGGPTLIRAAAKNYSRVLVVTDPQDYATLLEKLKSADEPDLEHYRFTLARKAFTHTAHYDAAISNYLTALDTTHRPQVFPEQLHLNFALVERLRYGENPHQQAAFYRNTYNFAGNLADYRQIQGKSLSYNNIADADAAWACVKTFEQSACVIVKHANPCGVAIADTPQLAYERSLATDPVSAFGGIIAFNRTVDEDTIRIVLKQFVEVVIAPSFTEAARHSLMEKPNIRALVIPLDTHQNQFDLKRIDGGLLVQTPDDFNITQSQLRTVTKLKPTETQLADCLFAWHVVKFIKSNAIVFCADGQTLGIGAGQMSRVDSVRIASSKAKQAGYDLTGSVVASDAFFPFRDGVDVLADAGASVVIQPGGSIRDEEVITAADERGLVMVLTDIRHFRH